MQFETLAKQKFDQLSAGQKKVAEYILQHLEKCSYDTIAKIGREVSVSETTVIRLAYALGYSSFSEMQSSIRSDILDNGSMSAALEDEHSAEPPCPYAQAIERDIRILKQTLNQLDTDRLEQAVERIVQAESVFVVGYRTAYSAANWFAMTLGFLRDNVRLIPLQGDVLELLASVNSRSVVVAVTFPRYAKETYKFVRTAKEQGAHIIAVTDNKLSPVGCVADDTLITSPNRDEAGFNSTATAISLLNLLAVGVRMKEHDRIKTRLQKLEELYSSYDILFE